LRGRHEYLPYACYFKFRCHPILQNLEFSAL
jgi:hypothetical protein